MMEQSQPQERHVADQVFQESLEQLVDILQENPTEEEEIPKLHIESISQVEPEEDLTTIDLEALEDAVADIEQFLEQKTKTQ